ncbi:Hypothetical Protein XCAW_00965 [Xanthomonas citri subsp. citri Aw12879]|nr:Hypothetical Protein XCAW_00965 [Xanthomonas citri subsp. citri Aw12879]QYF43351.1 hypothetical protein HZS93_00605 [Xanthomonas citri]
MSEAEWHRRGAHDRSRPTARSCRHGNRKQVPAASDGRSGRDTHGWPLPQTTGRPSAASAPSRHCAFGSYRHRHRQVAGLARAAINQATGSGAGTIRAMSTAEMLAGEIVSPPARCACLRLIAAAMCACAQSVAAGDTGTVVGGRRLRDTVIAHRRCGRRAHRCAGPSLPSKR